MSTFDDQNNIQNVQPQTTPRTDGKSTASILLGTISLIVLLISFGVLFPISLILSVLGFILGAISMKENPSGMAKAGRILNIIPLTICIVATLFFVVLLVGGIISGYTSNFS